MPQRERPALVLEELAVARGGRLLLRGLTLSLAPGRGAALVGPNGAGKTSLLRVVAGLLPPASGTVALTGGDGAPAAERLHFLGLAEGLKPSLTVAEHIAFWRALLGGPVLPATDEVLAEVGLGGLGGTPAGWLSSGQRRRLTLARPLVAPRPLWLMDEPLNALDIAGAALLRRMLAGHLAGGGIAMVATHAPLLVEGFEDVRVGGSGGVEP